MGTSGYLLHNMLLFGRILRGLGLDVHTDQILHLVRSLEHINLADERDFYFASRTLLVRRQEDLKRFDEAYERFWRLRHPVSAEVPQQAIPFRQKRLQLEAEPLSALQRAPSADDDTGNENEPLDVLDPAMTYSPREALRHKDFADLSSEEVEAIERLISGLLWRLGSRKTRRKRAGQGPLFDLRRSLRSSLRHGGELMVWARREPKLKPRPLVVLADVSGSMERYTRLLLHFIYGLAEGLAQPVEAFVFSTRLTRITRGLRGRDVQRVLENVSGRVPDWSGGTRIGAALKVFNYRWARRIRTTDAVVLLITDGWDRGDIDLLAREMARLQRSCHRLIWLNPLLGGAEYQPLTRGVQAALPYADDFLPAHNLASLEDLADHLGRLAARRPVRRQWPVASAQPQNEVVA